MKRFLMLVGVAVVAAAMYVAAAPGSQQAKGPSLKQYNVLKKEVSSLNKKVAALTKSETAVAKVADDADGFINTCLISTTAGAWAVSEFGDGTAGTFGYYYTDNGTDYSNVTALDFDTSSTPDAWLQAVDPACISTSGAPRAAGHADRARFAPHTERAH
jgi:hypothetical protein